MDNNTIETKPFEVLESEEKIEKKPKKFNLKIAIIIVVILAIGVLGYIFKGLFVVASVDGSLISRFEILSKLEKTSGKSLLDSLITEKLIKNEAKAKGVSVSNDEVNAEIKKVEDQITAQGGTLDAALAAQSMTLNDLRDRIVLQKDLEKLLGDKISVSDQEIEKYITDNKVTLPKGQEAETKAQIKDTLISQKLNTEAPTLIDSLKSKANIKYFVNY